MKIEYATITLKRTMAIMPGYKHISLITCRSAQLFQADEYKLRVLYQDTTIIVPTNNITGVFYWHDEPGKEEIL